MGASAPPVQGPPGPPGDINQLKSSTMWCADGNFCTIPNKPLSDFGTGNNNSIQFGADIPVGNAPGQREGNAGKMGYNLFGGTDDRPLLTVVGGGREGQPRLTRFWDQVQVTGAASIGDGKFWFNPGTDEWVRLFNNTNADYGDRGFAAQKLWGRQLHGDYNSTGRIDVPNGLSIGGKWAIYPNNEQLCFHRYGKGDVMCLDAGWDKVQIFGNNDHKSPYFYYNQNKDFGVIK